MALPVTALEFFIGRKEGEGAITADKDGHTATCTQGRARLRLPILPAEDFPECGLSDDGQTFELIGHEFAGVLATARPAMSNEEARYYLNGVYIHPDDGGLKFVATNGHQLHLAQLHPEAEIPDFSGVIIPSKTVNQIISLFGDSAEALQIHISETAIRISCEHLDIQSKLIDGTFPDYLRVIPQKSEHCITLSARDLAAALKTLLYVPADSQPIKHAHGRGVRVQADKGKLNLSTSSHLGSEAHDTIDAETGRKLPPAFGISAKYLGESSNTIASGCGQERISLFVNSPGDPVRITPSGKNDGDSFAIVMPMRL